MAKSFLFFSVLILFLGSCTKESAPEYRIPEEVEPYVQAFVREAKLRGIDLKIDDLIVEFAQPDAIYICGMCNGVKVRQKHIILGIQKYCWKEATPQTREGLVFHELAHCYLARLHTSKKFTDGTYASLMNPDNTEVYSVCQYPIDNGNDCDKRSRRQYYVDELFDETTSAPAWAK